METIVERFVKDYIDRFSIPFLNDLKEKTERFKKEVEERVPHQQKRELLTRLYILKKPEGSLGGWKRYLLLNQGKSVGEIQEEITKL